MLVGQQERRQSRRNCTDGSMSHWSSLQDNMDQCKSGHWVLYCVNRRNGKLYSFQNKHIPFCWNRTMELIICIINVIFCMLKICEYILRINLDYIYTYESLFWLLCFPCRMQRKLIKRSGQCNCSMWKTYFFIFSTKNSMVLKNQEDIWDTYNVITFNI